MATNFKKSICIISFILNGVFILFLLFFGLKYQDQLMNTFMDKKKKANIVFFGDSIIKEGKWNKLLDRSDIKNSGFSGYTTSHLNWLVTKHVISYHPEICFLEGGINDIAVGIPLKRIKANYKSLIDTLLAYEIEPIVQSTLYEENNNQSKILVDSLNNFLVDYCYQNSVRYLNINSELSTDIGLKPKYSRDGTHITEVAYRIWATKIQDLLKDSKPKTE
jgi:alpha-glucosidase